jgi:hypothetical protein
MIRFLAGTKDFSLLYRVKTGSDAHPAYYPMGYKSLFPQEVKQFGREADRSPPSSAEVHFRTRFHGVMLKIKHRDIFTFTHNLTILVH